MKKTMLLALLFLTNSAAYSQAGFPTKAECEKFIQSNAALRKEVVEDLGVSWDKLTIKSDGWKGYQGTVFSLSLTDCGKNARARGAAWPDDAAFAKWIVTTPKNKEGIYKELGIYMDYKRTTYDGEYCKVGDWHFNGYRIESGSEYGHKEFTTTEMQSIFFEAAKSGQLGALNNFIEIEEVASDRFYQNVPQPGERRLSVYFIGTEGKFADDHSVMYCSRSGNYALILYINNIQGKWVIRKSEIDDRDESEEVMPLGQYCYMRIDEKAENYESYETKGWEAIYGKITERSTDGKYGSLMARMEALNVLIKEKGTSISAEDLAPFVQPSKRNELQDETLNICHSFEGYTLPYLAGKGGKSLRLDNYKFGGASFLTAKTADGGTIVYGLPNVDLLFSRMQKKGKNWLEIGGNTTTGGGSSRPDYGHSQTWVFIDNEWYLFDVLSAYGSSSIADETIEELTKDM